MTAEPMTVAEGFCFLEAPRWRDGRLWFSDFYGYQVSSMRVAQAEDRPSGLRLGYQVLRLALEGYRGVGFVDRDGDASDESAVHPDVSLEVSACVHYCDVHGAVDLLRLVFRGGYYPPRVL